MKKLFILIIAAMGATGAFAQSAKVVVNSRGEVEGYYVRTNANTYTVMAQDDGEVPRAGHKVVTFSAENGQGVVIPKNGTVNVRNTPSTSGAKVGKLECIEGYIPDTAQCLGKVNGWYKVRLYNGKIGYIRQDLVDWYAIDCF